MSRIKTWKESEERRLRKRKGNKMKRGNPYIEPVVKSVDTSKLSPEVMGMVFNNVRKGFITRNSECPCDSHRRFKNCCMRR